MRICIIAVNLPNPISDNVGGACEKIIYHIVKELSQTHEIHLVVDENMIKLQPEDLKSTVHFHGFRGSTKIVSKLYDYIRFASFLNKLDNQHDFDIFHSFSYPFAAQILFVGRLKGKRVFFSELTHITWIHHRRGFSSNANFWINIFPAVQFGTATIVPSDFIKTLIVRSTKCPRRKIVVIPYGVPSPPNSLKKYLFREKHMIPKSQPILTFVGRLVPPKGVHYILESLYILKKNYPRILLVIAGPDSGDFIAYSNPSNSHFQYLKSLTKKLDILDNVMFSGFLRIDELYELLIDSTIFVFPTTEEAFGLVLIEAMSVGLPIITTNAPPMTEIVDIGLGGLVEPNSAKQIAEKVSLLLSNPVLLREVTERSLSRFTSNYELSHMIRRLSDLYASSN
jgi:glycosyltransferase involved in cell wall biosynthesis